MTLQPNQTAQPTALGYLVLAVAAGLGLYALVKSREAQAAPGLQCAQVTGERLGLFRSAFDVAVAWFPERATPPEAQVLRDGRISFPTARALTEGAPEPAPLEQPVIVVISGDQFWRYTGVPEMEANKQLSQTDRDNYCAIVRDAERTAA
jgi:hypothetical protein